MSGSGSMLMSGPVDVWAWFHVDVWAWFHAAGTTKRDVYFPEGRWFDWYNQSVATETGGTTLNLPTPVDHIQVHVYMKNELPRVGLEPTRTHDALTCMCI